MMQEKGEIMLVKFDRSNTRHDTAFRRLMHQQICVHNDMGRGQLEEAWDTDQEHEFIDTTLNREFSGRYDIFFWVEDHLYCALAVVEVFEGIYTDVDVLYIQDLVVEEHMRRKGIGKKIFAALEVEAAHMGCTGIQLHCLAHNNAAFEFYENAGMTTESVLFSKKIFA